MSPTIAYFVSPHGFGHAARSVAVMEALGALQPDIHFEIFTTVPAWFFEDSGVGPFTLHPVVTDVGLVQTSSLEEDPAATVRALDELLPFAESRVAELAETVRAAGCRLLVADISPLGLAVAARAGIPGILVESFTWDWIYQGYLESEPGLARYLPLLRQSFESAAVRIQTEPCCQPQAGSTRVGPVSRRFRAQPGEIRRRLDIADDRPMALLTMGGVVWDYPFLDLLERHPEMVFVIPGGADRWTRRGNLVLLPHHTPLYHPDLVAAADVVIGKLGYSTLAESYRAGVPLVFVRRPQFPESPILAEFAQRHLPCHEISAEEFGAGTWLEELPQLLGANRPPPVRANGADEIAVLLDSLLVD
jgi:UDP:flavonoid glycosyltransferase YjiC (YdhE family)